MFDILVVGRGLSDAVVARYFAEKGKKVMIWDQNKYIMKEGIPHEGSYN